MKPNEEIMEFLKENPTFYLATVDGYLPRVRPIGFAMWYNGHLCIALGKHKAAYKQLLDNLTDGKVFKREGQKAWHCMNCGHVHYGDKAPEVCPVCSHPKAYFELMADNY